MEIGLKICGPWRVMSSSGRIYRLLIDEYLHLSFWEKYEYDKSLIIVLDHTEDLSIVSHLWV